MNKILDSYFRGSQISRTDPLTVEVLGKAMDIDISREYLIPYAPSIQDLEVWEYRFLSLYLQKKRFWEKKHSRTPTP